MHGDCIRSAKSRENFSQATVLPTMPDLPANAMFLLQAWIGLAVGYTLLWLRQLRTRNATSVDAAWALSIGLLTAISAGTGEGSTPQRWLMVTLAGIWSIRLAWHLMADRIGPDHAEDGRYRSLRRWLGRREASGFFWVYQTQALLALGFATPFVLAARNATAEIMPLQIAGVALAVLSQALEWTADRQLAAHRRDPANSGRTCRSGLWRYSRHPNYFFEWLTWCGFGLATATALGWYAAIAPVAMWLSIRFVTGVPFTEKQAMASRGEDYRRYAAVTNAFFPWIPRRPAAGGPTAP